MSGRAWMQWSEGECRVLETDLLVEGGEGREEFESE